MNMLTDIFQPVAGGANRLWLCVLLVASLFLTDCGSSGGSSAGVTVGTPPCSLTQIEADMDSVLSQVSTDDVNFSFSVERQDGRRHTYGIVDERAVRPGVEQWLVSQ